MSGRAPSVRWAGAYRVALHLLPAALRRKHGPAMEMLFAREVADARARGRRHEALAAAAGLWDVVRRGAYERVRPPHRAAAGDRRQEGRDETRSAGAHAPHGEPHMPLPTTRQLLRRLAASFAIALVALTVLLLGRYVTQQGPALSALRASGAPAGTLAEVLLLSVPFTVALTIPMAVFVAVLREFTRLGADGTLAAARRGEVRRLVAPVLAAAVVVAALTLVSNTAVLPRANERLAAVLAGRAASAASVARSDREMTVGELRAAARRARAEAGADTAPQARAMAAVYEVEVQKKYALAAACVVLALAGMAISRLVARDGGATTRGTARGAAPVIGASVAVFGLYYVLLVTGEGLAERLVVSPVVGMWGANAFLLGAALLLALWQSRTSVEAMADPTVPIRR